MSFPIPPNFAKTYIEMFGSAGSEWIEKLPARIALLAERWSLHVLPPFELSYNYVAPAVRADGTPAVLKVGWLNAELLAEISALRLYDGHGINRLLEADETQGALLLERLLPGQALVDMPDDDLATRIAAQVMRDLWIPAPPNMDGIFPTTARWGLGFQRLRNTFDGGTGPFPAPLVEQAERLFDEMEASASSPVLLHGDLHHWNILSAQRSPWLALDPKGVIGEPAYEVGALLRNPWPDMPGVVELLRYLPRRLDILHEMLGFDQQRMLAWSMAQAILSSWWLYEDMHRVGEEMIAFAEGHLPLLKG